MSSSVGDKPVKSEDLPVLLGEQPAVEDKQSQDFEVYKHKIVWIHNVCCLVGSKPSNLPFLSST